MSVGFLVLVFTSIVDAESFSRLVTNAVGRHRERAATADTPSGIPPTSAPANPSTASTGTHRTRGIAAPRLVVLTSSCCQCKSPATRRDLHTARVRADADVAGSATEPAPAPWSPYS